MHTKTTIIKDGDFLFIPDFKIENVRDVVRFFGWLVFADLIHHPDDRFIDVLKNDREAAEYLDSVLNKCFDVCEETIDIYDLFLSVFYPELTND